MPHPQPIGLLLSGGLDSSILLGHLVRSGRVVQPFYIRGSLLWESVELASVQKFVAAISSPANASLLRPLVELRVPVDDLYGSHWSTTGEGVPDLNSPDEAVFLPGRNPILLVKAAVWCQLHGIEELALAPLASNPFGDASDAFFDTFQQAMSLAMTKPLRIVRPFLEYHKTDVMRLGVDLPLEHTFSCISPRRGLHCGKCNKCAERQAAFRDAGLTDPTTYAD
jgi:7-cyano-7-deazaguanine synthase